MKIDEFEKKLTALIDHPSTLRPFICDGSPLDCDVFIVGVNPATQMKTDFWDFWISNQGYDKDRWFLQYQLEREKKPLKPGKSRRPAISPTRRNTDSFVKGAAGAKVLETNLDPRPAEDAKHLKKWSDLRTDVFEFLFTTVKPRAVLFHGKFASEAVKRYGSKTEARSERHLSYQTSMQDAFGYGCWAAQTT